MWPSEWGGMPAVVIVDQRHCDHNAYTEYGAEKLNDNVPVRTVIRGSGADADQPEDGQRENGEQQHEIKLSYGL